MQTEIRRMEVDAVAAMEARGMEVIRPDPEQLEEWRRFFEGGYPDLRGPLVPETWFDEALRLIGGPG